MDVLDLPQSVTTTPPVKDVRKPGVLDALSSWGPPHLIALTLVLGAGVFALAPPSDPDVWWHVRTGELILDTRQLPTTDPWSLVAVGREWVAHSWLAEVVIALFHRAFGLTGLSLYRCLGVTLLLGALAVQAFRRTSPYRALLVTTLAVFGTTGGWGERPQLLSFLLLIPAAQLVRAAVDGRRQPWLLLPLTWLWANLHGLWFLAVALLLVGALSVLLSQGFDGGRQRASRLVVAAVACTALAGLTPNGLAVLAQPLRVQGYGQFVSEWGPPSIHSPFGAAFFAILLTLVVVYGRRTQPVDVHTLLQVTFAALLGLLYIRTVAPAVVLLVPLLAAGFGSASALPSVSRLQARANKVIVGALTASAVAGGAFVLVVLPPLPDGAPVEATAAVVASAPGQQRVINEYGIGGWLIGRAPSVRPAIDGRAEIYPLEFVAAYDSALRLSGDWRGVLEPLQADAALLYRDAPLVNGLRDQLGWTTTFQDDVWIVLIPPAPVETR